MVVDASSAEPAPLVLIAFLVEVRRLEAFTKRHDGPRQSVKFGDRRFRDKTFASSRLTSHVAQGFCA